MLFFILVPLRSFGLIWFGHNLLCCAVLRFTVPSRRWDLPCVALRFVGVGVGGRARKTETARRIGIGREREGSLVLIRIDRWTCCDF